MEQRDRFRTILFWAFGLVSCTTSAAALFVFIVGSALGEQKLTEGVRDVAKSIKGNARRFGIAEYPHLAAVADLHHAVVRVIVGLSNNLMPDYIRSVPGRAHVMARPCQVIAHNENCLATLEPLGKKFQRVIRASELKQRLRSLDKKLRNNAAHGTGAAAYQPAG